MGNRLLKVGIISLQTYGFSERSIAIDILASIVENSGHILVFVKDASFTSLESIWDTVSTEPDLDVLAVSLRPGSGSLIKKLKSAIIQRQNNKLEIPNLIIGGHVAQASPDLINEIIPAAFVSPEDAEVAFPIFLEQLASMDFPNSLPTSKEDKSNFIIPSNFSLKQTMENGGTVWIENSRGCGGNCSFCCLSNCLVNRHWRRKDTSLLFDEIERIYRDFGIKIFSFSDFSSFETEESIIDFIETYKKHNLPFRFRCDLRLDIAKKFKTYLPDLYQVGLKQIFTGIETLVPSEQKLYGKDTSDLEIISYIQSIGIRVVGGFITIQPLVKMEELYSQVVALKNQGVLYLITTPLKTIRIFRGTSYEKLCKSKGILGELNSDLFTYEYHCIDPFVDIIRKVVQFFDLVQKELYFNFYMENMIRLKAEDNLPEGMDVLTSISKQVQEVDYWLLYQLVYNIRKSKSIRQAKENACEIGLEFNKIRDENFEIISMKYESLLSTGFPYYRNDLMAFIEKWKSTPKFDLKIIQ